MHQLYRLHHGSSWYENMRRRRMLHAVVAQYIGVTSTVHICLKNTHKHSDKTDVFLIWLLQTSVIHLHVTDRSVTCLFNWTWISASSYSIQSTSYPYLVLGIGYHHHHRRLWTQANASMSASLATCYYWQYHPYPNSVNKH